MRNVLELALASNLHQLLDRRSFVIGSATSAAILVTRPALAQRPTRRAPSLSSTHSHRAASANWSGVPSRQC